MKRRGRFVVLEGLDGAGTTTQAHLLAAALRRGGRAVVLTHEPSNGPVGVLLRRALRGQLRMRRKSELSEASLALLFAADRLEHLASTIEPALASGSVVVSDRYLLSSLAYQGRVLDLAWVEALNAQAPPPDLTIFLEVQPRIAASRRNLRGGRRERFESARTQAAVARAYEAVVKHKARSHHIRRLDGEQPVEVVAGQVRAAVAALLEPQHARRRPR
jgi:dTMP kinase